MQLLFFKYRQNSYALPLENVERVLPLVEITPLENENSKILGVINLQGEIIPLVDFANLFNIERKEISLDSRIIILKTKGKRFGFLVEEVEGYREVEKNSVVEAGKVWENIKNVKGIAKGEDEELIVIYDVEKLLSAKEIEEIQKQVKKQAAANAN